MYVLVPLLTHHCMYDVLHASDTLNEPTLPLGLPLGLEVAVGLETLGSMHLSERLVVGGLVLLLV